MPQTKTVKDLDLTPNEEKRLMMILQVGFVPPDLPAEMALKMLDTSAPWQSAATPATRATTAATRAPSPAWTIWTKVRGPIIVAAIGALVLWANYGQ